MMEAPAHILLVDGEADRAQQASRILTREGYVASAAGTGAEALRISRTVRPDLVLLDRHLPDLSGLEVCRQIKGDPELTEIMVVLVSDSDASEQEQAELLTAGADDHLLRPIGDRELRARLETFVRIARLTDLPLFRGIKSRNYE